MKIVINILLLLLLISCGNNKQITPRDSDVFLYIDKATKDTIKFYGFKDLDTAIYYAKKERKNILVVFSGYACSAVHGMEWKTLSLYQDKTNIQNNFILAWLPVDDQTIANDTSQVVFWYSKQRKLIKKGDQYKYFEEHTFQQSTQPLLCFIDTLKKPYGKSIGYTPDKQEVEAFINSGLIK